VVSQRSVRPTHLSQTQSKFPPNGETGGIEKGAWEAPYAGYGKVGNAPYRCPPNFILGEGKGGQTKGRLPTLHGYGI